MWILVILAVIIAIVTVKSINEKKYRELETEVLKKLGFSNWNIVSYYDEYVTVKSRQALEKYDDVKFFKENREKLVRAKHIIKRKNEIATILKKFLNNNEYTQHSQYNRLSKQINEVVRNAGGCYRIRVTYISSAGNNLGERLITVSEYDINRFEKDPSLLMSKGEYSKLLKEQQKEALNQKQHEYYNRVNQVIDYANDHREALFTRGSLEQLDNSIAQLFDRTVNSIKKVKTIDSEEWEIIGNFISRIEDDIKKVVSKNQRILEYYESSDFLKIKETCEVLMSTQREFNEYITEKIESISHLFGTRVVRNETINDDEYQYIRPYKKAITPFTAEVSAAVFASAENNPIDYVIKNFPQIAIASCERLLMHLFSKSLNKIGIFFVNTFQCVLTKKMPRRKLEIFSGFLRFSPFSSLFQNSILSKNKKMPNADFGLLRGIGPVERYFRSVFREIFS